MLNLKELFFEKRGQTGFTCDICGKEVFSYPSPRICPDCEKDLPRNEPYSCPVCGRKTRALGACMDCKEMPPVFKRGFSPFSYGEMSGIMYRFKTGEKYLGLFLGEECAKFLWEKYLSGLTDAEKSELLITYVPLTESSEKTRGYNQSEMIAKTVSEKTGAPVKSLLEKCKDTLPQKGLDRKERSVNLVGAYSVSDRESVKGKTVILVDDIMTTGATGNECSKKLLSAKAKAVYFLTATSVAENKA